MVSKGTFPGDVMLGKSLFHQLGFIASPEGVHLLRLPSKLKLVPVQDSHYAIDYAFTAAEQALQLAPPCI